MTRDQGSAYVTELRYYPYGRPRYNPGSQQTDYRFTGQRWQGDIGLYYYGARWYDHLIGRFAQADSIVPEPGNPQSLNRYAYVLNNPLKYIDPTGHRVTDGCSYEGCNGDRNTRVLIPRPFWKSAPPPVSYIVPGGEYGDGMITWGGEVVPVYHPPSIRAYADGVYSRGSRCISGTACLDTSFVTGDYWWGNDYGNTCVSAVMREYGAIVRGSWELAYTVTIDATALNGRLSFDEYMAGAASGTLYQADSLPSPFGEMGTPSGRISAGVDALNITAGALKGIADAAHTDSYHLQRNSAGVYRVIIVAAYGLEQKRYYITASRGRYSVGTVLAP